MNCAMNQQPDPNNHPGPDAVCLIIRILLAKSGPRVIRPFESARFVTTCLVDPRLVVTRLLAM